MKRLLTILGLVGALSSLPLLAWGADGDKCKALGGTAIATWAKGPWVATQCVQLCDGKLAADDTNDCTEYDFSTSQGMPDIVVLEYDEDAASGCSAGPDFTVTTGPITGGTPEYSPSSSAVVLNSTTDRVVIVTKDAPLDRYLFIEGNDLTDCANNGVDIRMFMLSRKNNP